MEVPLNHAKKTGWARVHCVETEASLSAGLKQASRLRADSKIHQFTSQLTPKWRRSKRIRGPGVSWETSDCLVHPRREKGGSTDGTHFYVRKLPGLYRRFCDLQVKRCLPRWLNAFDSAFKLQPPWQANPPMKSNKEWSGLRTSHSGHQR